LSVLVGKLTESGLYVLMNDVHGETIERPRRACTGRMPLAGLGADLGRQLGLDQRLQGGGHGLADTRCQCHRRVGANQDISELGLIDCY
jgi:hypothetical protein